MNCRSLIFSQHAITQMFARVISTDEVVAAVKSGEIIESHPDDKPFPSFLLLANIADKALHVVIAKETINSQCVVVTAYEPDPKLWESGFKKRRSK